MVEKIKAFLVPLYIKSELESQESDNYKNIEISTFFQLK